MKKEYQDYIGIDIGKSEMAVYSHHLGEVNFFPNNQQGYKQFCKKYSLLPQALVILETTGGYEVEMAGFLVDQQIDVHRANTRKVKAFIRSLRLDDLKQMLVQEKNRFKAPENGYAIGSIGEVISLLEKQIKNIEDQIDEIKKDDKEFQTKMAILKSIPGIGIKTARSLLIDLPELGQLDRKQVASLSGLAPHCYDSGTRRGYRKTRGGRPIVKSKLFMAALSACRTHSSLGAFYNRLLASGKKKMVALTALMRKIIVIANALIRENNFFPA
jgi:transposase